MSLIYEPKGKAREYSPLALNVYTGGCDHLCDYCYCQDGRRWGSVPNKRNLVGLAADASNANRQVLLSFMSDPYCKAEREHRNTRYALSVLSGWRCSVAILTKGGTRCLDDLHAFKSWPDGRIKVGASLTFATDYRSLQVEPGAALPSERIEALKILHEEGVQTWASIEPVIDEAESLHVIYESVQFVDGYKVGKLNHRKSTVDWEAFVVKAVSMIRGAGRKLYVKHDLQPFAPVGFLTAEECDPETLTLPDRPM